MEIFQMVDERAPEWPIWMIVEGGFACVIVQTATSHFYVAFGSVRKDDKFLLDSSKSRSVMLQNDFDTVLDMGVTLVDLMVA